MTARLCSIEECGKPHFGHGWCQAHYTRWRRRGSVDLPVAETPPRPDCSVEGCANEVGEKSARGLCVSHYSRWQRWGDAAPDKPLRTYREGTINDGGYRVIQRNGHPLARSNGQVLEHRVVAYEKYGPGDQVCHWCAVEIDWPSLDVDHLDGVRTNNVPSNLVVACKGCNSQRANTGNYLDYKPMKRGRHGRKRATAA